VDSQIVSIIVDRIENGAIYSKDGAQYEITRSTSVVDYSSTCAGVKTGELVFENGKLTAVTLR
jgi:hypothetical protein